jgi:NAD/NADP transhydrogenase beta subunit
MKPIRKAIIVGIITVAVYLSVVVITTPALEPLAAINAAFQLNSIVIIGMGIGIGLQVFLSEKSKMLGCKLIIQKKAFGGNTGSTAATSFFSFFSLVPLGCCGWWLYALSLLPSVVGTGVSAVLIEYSQVLAYVGLTIIFGFAGLTAYKLKQEMKLQKII